MISDTFFAKFLNLFFVLQPQTRGIISCDDNVSLEIKGKISQNLNNINESEEKIIIPSKRIITFKNSKVGEIVRKELDQFIGL